MKVKSKARHAFDIEDVAVRIFRGTDVNKTGHQIAPLAMDILTQRRV